MIVDITPQTHDQIKNPALAAYAAIYLEIYQDFMRQVRASGMPIAAEDDHAAAAARKAALQQQGATLRNSDRSLYINAISPACVACQKGVGSATFFISLQCHRHCYFCFNPNQVQYDHYQTAQRDLIKELSQVKVAGQRMDYLALTGGEPLLHAEETVDFFAFAGEHFPETHTRLYTTGDQADETLLRQLAEAGLEEIRFSLRQHDSAQGRRHTLERIALAKEQIPAVMVEMPVLPGGQDWMKELLLELERLQIHSINLLEFCYPFNNAAEFRRRGFAVRKRPFHTLYDYWYAGGVPIAGSEMACLELMEFALAQDLSIGVHYCSLENKLTGQNYQQNFGRAAPKTAYFSQNDYLFKTAKVFGNDIKPVYRALRRAGCRHLEKNRNPKHLAFHVREIETLRRQGVTAEIGVATGTLEQRDDGAYLRELKVDLTTPDDFDMEKDL